MADQLIAIKIEYRENHGSGMIRLFWESISQPFAIIDSPRMYYNASHIHGSPFGVKPQATKPSSPTFCSVEIAGWDSLRVISSPPEDYGGIVFDKYLIESWDVNKYGVTEKQQLRISRTITGGSFFHWHAFSPRRCPHWNIRSGVRKKKSCKVSQTLAVSRF